MADILKHLDLNSADGTQLNLDALYQVAPSAFTEVRDDKTGEISRKVNFEVLRRLLGDHATDGDGEMYQFTWVGKNAARAEAAKPTDKTLRPVVEDSGEITDYYDYTDCFAGHKIGGYPNYIQSGIDFGDGYEFMIQIASDEKANLNIIDSGNFYLAKNSQTGDWRLYCDFY